MPSTWSVNATNILAQKYFRGTLGTDERETSLRQVVDRIVDTICEWGMKDGYFVDDEEAETFRGELKHLIVHQKAAFNSPVWFNIGVTGVPQQASACFILAVNDSMDSILNWYTEEGVIFKGGSGAGVNLSRIRASQELLAGGGTASGPVSFMRGADASAGTIKSGGKTRRAAKMVILDVDHPDVEEFIWCKANEERKARVLRDAGFDMDLDGKDIHSIQYQNANNSVRVSDDFMQAVLEDETWNLRRAHRRLGDLDGARAGPVAPDRPRGVGVRGPRAAVRHDDQRLAHRVEHRADQRLEPVQRVHAHRQLGVQPREPQPDDVPRRTTGRFDVDGFTAAVEVVFTAQEILVGNADYPTKKIGENSIKFRQLGLGYANLGALLMASGLPYDSDGGRAWAGGDHRAHDRPRLRDERADRRADGAVRRLPRERRADAARAAQAPRRTSRRSTTRSVPGRAARGRAAVLGRRRRARRAVRRAQLPGDRARADRDDRAPHGLRHDRASSPTSAS